LLCDNFLQKCSKATPLVAQQQDREHLGLLECLVNMIRPHSLINCYWVLLKTDERYVCWDSRGELADSGLPEVKFEEHDQDMLQA
jgi:hypothetical protein